MHKYNAETKTFIVIVLTLITMLAEIVVGYFTKSMALFADGWHMGTHVLALSLTFITYVLIRKFANSKTFAFGTGKFSTLSGYTSSILLGLTGIFIIAEAVERVFNPVSINYNDAIVVAIIGLAVNALCIFIMDEHDHCGCHNDKHLEHRQEDFNFKAAYMHILADAMTSVFAIVALFAAKYFGWMFLDPIVGMIGGVVICIWAFGLIKSTSMILLDFEANDIKTKVSELAEFKSLNVWKTSDCEYALVAVIERFEDVSSLKCKLKELAEFSSITIEATHSAEHQ